MHLTKRKNPKIYYVQKKTQIQRKCAEKILSDAL